jgi:hypothetical protein
MEDSRILIYIKSLERKVNDGHHYLKEAVEELRDMCRIVSPEKNVPQGIIVDIRELYKEIQNRFKEIKVIQQLLQGKYRQHYRRDPLRDKGLLELAFMVKTTFSRFEENVKLVIEKQKAKEREEASKKSQKTKILEWFLSREKQLVLLRNMRTLKELQYQSYPEAVGPEKRKTGGVRSLTLFLLHGDAPSINSLEAKIPLREHDFSERFHEREIRGVYTHLREVDPSEIEKVFRSLLERERVVHLKCLLIWVQPHQDMNPAALGSIDSILQVMKEGEVRTVSI